MSGSVSAFAGLVQHFSPNGVGVSHRHLVAVALPHGQKVNGGNSSPFGARGEPRCGQGEALRAIGRRFAPREAAPRLGDPLRGDGDHVPAPTVAYASTHHARAHSWHELASTGRLLAHQRMFPRRPVLSLLLLR